MENTAKERIQKTMNDIKSIKAETIVICHDIKKALFSLMDNNKKEEVDNV